MKKGLLSFVVLCVVAFMLGGCLNFDAQKDPSRFYIMGGCSDTVMGADGLSGDVGVVRITVPEYLNRNEIAVWSDGNEVKYDEFERWAEPVSEGVGRVLTESMSSALGVEVMESPWPKSFDPKYRVTVDLVHFIAIRNEGSVHLHARWRVSGVGEFEESGEVILDEPIGGDGMGYYNGLASAMSRVLGRLSGEIGKGLRLAEMDF